MDDRQRPPWPGPREVAAAILASLGNLERKTADPSPAAARARTLAATISETFNAVIPLVAPRLYQRWADESRDDLRTFRDACIALLDKLQEVAAEDTVATPTLPFTVSATAVSTLRGALAAWDGALPPPAELDDAAQDLLTSSGVPAPPGGWTAFDVPSG